MPRNLRRRSVGCPGAVCEIGLLLTKTKPVALVALPPDDQLPLPGVRPSSFGPCAPKIHAWNLLLGARP